ncbi:MAG: segregation/condensation protein A [Armatimonadota bacterium]|nr:segregation/condensation protein A [Armatimonadota bacterium]
MTYEVQLEVFSGPLDLLLHLIQKNQVEIYDIPIARITDQYLAYLRLMEARDIEVAGEFIVMAATLMEIKSRLLLPPEPREEGEEAEPDPRADLVRMLEEYRRYKEAAQIFQERMEVWMRVFPRGADLPDEMVALIPDAGFANLSPGALAEALQQVLLAAEAEHGVTEIRRERVTVRMKIAELWHVLASRPEGVGFRELFKPPYTRADVVATFLAVLELLRLGRIRVWQKHPFEEIWISRS